MKASLRPLTPLLVAAPLVTAVACNKNDDAGALPPLLQMRTSGEIIFGHPQNDCAECHPNHVAEWEMSPHAYATADPVFHAMSRLGQRQSSGKLGQFCVQCHTPVGLATDAAPVYQDTDGIWKQDTENLDPLSKTGVSCDICHAITDVLEPVNARAIITPNGVRRATIQDPVETPAHLSQYSPLHEKSDLCGMCHAVNNPKGAPLEETFPEWANSSFAQEGGQTCQDCHMLPYQGQAAKDGPQREVHRHFFVGVDVSLLPPEEFPGYQEMRDMAQALLQESANLRVTAEAADKRLKIEVENLAGHALPSGATAERQMWIEAFVEDAQGQVVFETGTFDPNGDVRDSNPKHTTMPGTDPQLIYWGQQMVDDPTRQDPNSTAPVKPVTFPWQASWRQNHLIPADGTDTEYLDLSALPAGEYTARLRLRFRTFPMYFLVELEHEAGLDPAVKTRV
ncbi:MAG: hypothetical protein KC933_32175, partial [Myxococcales bacterium]|nr:hypothetical protein [Myxococcales bacterium]